MDQPTVGAEIFVLKTDIHSNRCEKMMTKLLLDIKGVERIFPDAGEVGKVTVLGTIDPWKLMEILRKNGINSDLVLEPIIDPKHSPDVLIPQSPAKQNHILDTEMVLQLQKLSKVKGFKSIVAKKDGIKLTYKEDENVQHLDGKSGSCSARNLHESKNFFGEDVMNYDFDFHGNHESCCSTNHQGMYCYGCGSTQCRPMAPRESISLGVPFPAPGYIPSAPPVPECYPDPALQEQSSDRPSSEIYYYFFFLLFLFIFLFVPYQ